MHPSIPRFRIAVTPAFAASLALLSSCYSPAELRDRADRDAYALIDTRRKQLFGEESPFKLPAATERFGRWGESAVPATATVRERWLAGSLTAIGPIDILDALEIAAEDSQDVQEQKEALYLAALDLTEDQWRFGERYTAGGDGSASGDVDFDSVSVNQGFGASVTRILGSGATILANVGTDLFRFVTTGDGWDIASNVGISITQPLLQGSGRLVTLEPLRQSQRNLVYSVRSYERFRRTFSVDVTERVLRVLQSVNQLENERLNFQNLQLLRTRNERFAEAGLLSEVQADQARQDTLRSENRLIVLQGNLDRQTDSFKVFLGLPVEVDLTIQQDLLENLSSDESFLDGLNQEELVRFAIDHRLDVMTSFDRVQDAVRREAIARDALRTGLTLTGSLDGSPQNGFPIDLDLDDLNGAVAADLDLPIDLLPLRNSWRRAELTLVDRRRSYDRFLDNVAITVRDALRRARNAYESLVIQRGAVELAERRVKGADLSFQAGLATTRDVLEAQEALRQVRDSLTSAKIDFTLALLDLWLELEILRVDETGVHVDEALVQELRARLEAN